MNIAIILAGGNKDIDSQGIPIQFISINDKPILIYTLERFQNHPQIDAIEVVCLDGWQDATRAFARQFNIDKLSWIINGGNTGQESIRNGIYNLKGEVSDDDTVIIHDGTRPMLDGDVLTDVLRVAHIRGNAVAATRYSEQMFYVDDFDSRITNSYIDRDTIRKVTTPQAYKYKEILESYKEAFSKKIALSSSSYSDTMMVELGKEIYFATGSDQNIKIETDEDIDLFRYMLSDSQSGWLK